MPDPKPPTRPYLQALQYVSTRTGAPLSSLVVSFAILHEVTAIVPFAAFFYASRQLGMGQVFVDYIRREGVDGESGGLLNSAAAKARDWTDEGEKWVGRVGRRYEIWGLRKGDPVDGDLAVKGLAGDVANAVVAYGFTKLILPARIGLSLYLSPAFSRRIIDPFRATFVRAFQRFGPPKA